MDFELNYNPIALSVRDTAFRLSLGRSKIYKLVKSGQLKSRLVGRRRLISMSSIQRLLERETGDGGGNA